jgi:hypothetical protein
MVTGSFNVPLTTEVFIAAQILIIIFALFLMALSITAYRNTSLKKIVYAIVAFALFAFQHVINFIAVDEVKFIPDDVRYALFSIITLTIMGLFFLSIVRK